MTGRGREFQSGMNLVRHSYQVSDSGFCLSDFVSDFAQSRTKAISRRNLQVFANQSVATDQQIPPRLHWSDL